MPLFNIQSIHVLCHPSHTLTSELAIIFIHYPVPRRPALSPKATWNQAFNHLLFPAYYLLALGLSPAPLCTGACPDQTEQRCCHEEQEGYPLLTWEHRTLEPLSLACPGRVGVQKS